MDSTPPSKDTDLQTRLQRKAWQSVVYKRQSVVSDCYLQLAEKHWLGWKAGKTFTNLMATENRQE
jgi:hypothetical protein